MPENAAEATEEAAVEVEATEAQAAEQESPTEGEEALGDPGKKALATERAARKAAEKRAQEAEARAEAALAKAEGREAEHLAEQERAEIERTALAKANERILSAELRAAATGKLAYPEDVLKYVDITDFEVSDDGAVDADAITAAIADLIERRPLLAARGGTGAPKADHSQGASGGVGKRTTGQLFAAALEGK